MKLDKLMLVADAGATHTRAAVVAADGRILGSGRSAAGNAFAIGHAAASRNLRMALITALKEARVSPARISFAVVGSASVTHDGRGAKPIVRDMRQYLKDSRIHVVGDCRIALEGALAGAPGVVTVAGTGSIVLAKNSTGQILRVGGWGPLAGDEGSAQWTARRAIQEATHAADGLTKPTLLIDLFRRHFKLTDFDRIIENIYAHPMTPSELGALAPLVTQAADKRDAIAKAIFAEGAKALAQQAVTAVRRLHLRKPLISHQGSMFTVEDHFRTNFEKELHLQIPAARFVRPSLPPLGGAFLLALEGCNIRASAALLDTFKEALHG